MKAIRCKACGAPIAEENLVERLAMARCGHCDTIFALGPQFADRPRPRAPVALPKGIAVEDTGLEWTLRRRWYAHVAWGMLLFCVFWNGFMLVWHSIALSTGAWHMSLFGLLHTAVGLGVGYFTAAMFLNSTVIRSGQGLLSVRHAPLPWPGKRDVATFQLDQLYVKSRVVHGKNGSATYYDVHCRLRDETSLVLLKSLESAEQALYIEQAIEAHLRIADAPVADELPR